MTLEINELYSSPNGDVWRLIRNNDTGRVVVRHQANLASGGSVTESDVADFLRSTARGAPEHQAALRAAESWVEPPQQG